MATGTPEALHGKLYAYPEPHQQLTERNSQVYMVLYIWLHFAVAGSRWAHGAWSACSALIGAAQPPSSALGALSAAVCTSSYPIALGSVAASLPCSRGDCLQAAPSRSFQTLALRHDAYRRAPRTYVQLLQHISRATKFAALEQLVAGYGDKFDGVHAAAALARLPKLVRPLQLIRYFVVYAAFASVRYLGPLIGYM